ncbi:putative translation elongation factor G [Ixodes scapularis]
MEVQRTATKRKADEPLQPTTPVDLYADDITLWADAVSEEELEGILQQEIAMVLATEENGLARLWQQHLKALEDGAALALAHGPLHGFPVVNVGVELSWCKVSRGTSVAMVTAAASQCLARALKEAAVVLLEPVMHVEVCTPESYLGRVLNDLSRRRAAIGEVQQRRDVRVVSAKAPLAELDNYADELRTLSSGRASFHMALEEYRPMGTQDTARALRRLAGLADDT